MDPFTQPWFWPAVAVIIGLPIVLLVLGEIHSTMVRRETPGARIVLLIRNVLAPLGAILILFSQIPQETGAEVTWAKIAATAFGFVLILVLLNGLNLAVFVSAKRGTWRNRLPSIFVDIARAVLIVVTLAVLFGWIWGADIGGLFTALGISTIVIGLALQNAVGGVVAGLFLLFEQPFELGEYLLTDWGRGRVVEINWRATHLDSGNGILVIPNGQLADSTFRNLSRATDPYETSTIVRFATDDPPQAVLDLLAEVGNGLPELAPGTEAYAVPLDKAKYEVNIPLTAPGKQYMTLGLFRTRLWYAARRAGLHLDRDLTDNYATPERSRAELLRIAHRLYLSSDEAAQIADQVTLERYGEGEVLQRTGTVPTALRIIVSGVVQLSVPTSDGTQLPISELRRDDIIGLTALTRQAVATTAVALVDVAVLIVPVEVVDTLVKTRPGLARDIGVAMDHRQEQGEKALAAAGETPGSDALVIS
jgi:small-conductance mechanosensitive channel/CRP-like cAMP-binding protein